MLRIINALILLMVGMAVVFFFTYMQNFSLDQTRIILEYYYLSLASTALFISLISYSKKKASLVSCLLFSLLIIGVQFFFHNQSYNYQDQPKANFEELTNLPQKKGVVIQDNINCISFGIMGRASEGIYLVKNVFYHSKKTGGENYSFFSSYAKIINNRLILYKPYILTEKKIVQPQKNFETSISFNPDIIFNLWDEYDRINFKKALPYFRYLNSFKSVLFLSLGKYLIGFIMILLIACIGLTFQNTAIFTYKNWIGILASYVIAFIFSSLILFYGSLFVQMIVNLNFIKM
ncbi:MAG: hypothetical protein ACRCTJ_02395 [Brevinema sp.]